jgi:hypothetical protein
MFTSGTRFNTEDTAGGKQKLLPVQTTASNSPDTLLADLEKDRKSLGKKATRNGFDFVPDGKCDGRDISVVAKCFGGYPGCAPPLTYNINCDVLNNGKIDGRDIAIVARQFGEHSP